MRERAVRELKLAEPRAVELTIEIGDVPDEELVERTRNNDRRAFAELWRRHYKSGITVARSFTTLDADDLVSESFARIYKRTLEGGGPRGAFRPYLYTTIRNLASTWGTQRAKHVNVDELDDFEPTESAEEPVARSLDRTLTVQAYRSLPARWQTVLWYTEVEGLDPHDVAPILGISANSVAALSYRAREGLRKAWLQAHVSDATASGTCAWVIERVGEHARRSLTERETQKLTSHLATCPKCTIVSEEVDDIGARLAMVMIPLLLGGVVGGTLLAAGATTGGAAAAATAASAGGGTVVAAATSTATLATIAASTIVIAAAGVGAVGLVQSNQQHSPSAASSTAQAGALADPLGVDTSSPSDTSSNTLKNPVDPASTAVPAVPSTTPPSTTTTTTTTTTDDSAPNTDTGTTTKSTDTDTPGSTDAPTVTATDKPATSSTKDSAGTDSTGKKVTKVVTTTTDTVNNVVTTTTSTVDNVVAGTTGAVDSIVDSVLPPAPGVTGTLNSTLDGVTSTLNSTVGTVTGTLNGTVGAATGLVGGLVGGLLGG